MRIGIIGCGNMGGGIARCLSSDYEIGLYDHKAQKSEALAKQCNGHSFQSLKTLMAQSDLVLLAVKPQQLESLAQDLQSYSTEKHTILSILTGTSLKTLQSYFPHSTVVRTMPNLAVVHGKGIVILTEDPTLRPEIKELVEGLAKKLGRFYWFPEDKIDALSSLIGSGPAFVYVIIESMVDAAIKMGLNGSQSQELILEMIKGAIVSLEKEQQPPTILRQKISSPAGITIEGIQVMEERGVRAGIMNAFIAAYERSKEIAATGRN